MDNVSNKGNIYRNKDSTHNDNGHSNHNNVSCGNRGSNGSDSTFESPV